jgi:hypothetical protein
MNIQDTIALLKISTKIELIVEGKDQFTSGDFQGAIEAQIMIAYQLGRKANNE